MIGVDHRPTPAEALAGLQAAVDQLTSSLDGDVLAGVGDDELVGFAQDFEAMRNRLSVVDQEIVAACESTELAPRLAHCRTAKLLVDTLRIDFGDAHRRVRAGRDLQAPVSMLGERLQPARPVLAAAVASGQVGAASRDRVLVCLTRIDRLGWTSRADVERAEVILTEAAGKLTPRELDDVIQQLVDTVDPDGTLSDDQVHESLRELRLWQRPDGSWGINGRLTPATGQKLNAVLEPLCRPQSTPEEPDQRSRGQRFHDALDEACTRLLQSDDLPASGGTPATVIVTIDLQDLLNRSGHGRFADGSAVAPDTVLKVSDQADVVLTLLARNGRVLGLGRDRRIADKHQTAAMIARDGGCTFPGCDRPPKWCERHHIVSWLDGGKTEIDNLTLVCRFHHRHFEALRWRCQMIDGLPYWIPPKWIDRDQKPRLHHRIQLHHRSALV